MDTDDNITQNEDIVSEEVTQEVELDSADVIADMVKEPAKYDFLLDKFKKEGRSDEESLAEQARAYNELQKRFGSFKGAPDEYKITLDDNLAEMGLTLETDDPIVMAAMEWAKKSNLDQEGFNGLINIMAQQEVARIEAENQMQLDAIKSMGENGAQLIRNLDLWGKSHLSPDEYKGFIQAGQSPESIRALAKLVSMTRNAPVNPSNTKPAESISESELNEMRSAVDARGQRRIAVDPVYRAEYEKKMALKYGTEPYSKVIG